MIAYLIIGAVLLILLALAIDWLRGQRQLSDLRDEGHANQRREGNRVLWWHIVGTDLLYRTEEEAMAEAERLCKEEQAAHPDWVLRPNFVMPWWVWDGRDPLEDRRSA